ncbi:hypothetical protein HYZ97_02900 [Candidatus Pacearchaeota archaeon]|nr:hypothetical protein [Candidatus Pacearchaeota archaeon]
MGDVRRGKWLGLLIVSVILASAVVFAAFAITPSSVGVLEDIYILHNITVNNSLLADGWTDITEVNITIPNSFTFLTSSNGTGAYGHNTTFSNTSTVLRWNNSGGFIFNTTAENITFWFNLSAATPGKYNITIDLGNSTGGTIQMLNYSVLVNDTTVPSTAAFNTTTELDGFNLSRGDIRFNASFADNGVLQTIIVELFNSTHARLNFSTNATSPFMGVFAGHGDGIYRMNFTVNDTYGNTNRSVSRLFRFDATFPIVALNTSTATNLANVTSVFVNVSVNETNEGNITFLIWNNTAVINSTTFNTSIRTINFTGLADGNYSYNVTVVDFASNRNTTALRSVNIDTTYPLIEFAGGTNNSGTNMSRNYLFVNVSVTETNEFNITFMLWNDTVIINTTSSTGMIRSLNFTGLNDGNYSYNVSVVDYTGNTNTSGVRTIRIDSTAPSITHSCDDTTVKSGETITCSCTATDAQDSSPVVVSVANPSTSQTGDFSTTCTATDFTGNVGTSTINYVVGSAGSGPSGGSGSSSSTSTSPWVSTHTATSEQVTAGITQALGSNERVSVPVSGATHHVAVLSLTSTTALIQIASTPQNVTMSVGESRQFEVSDDNYYDLNVTLQSISNNKANVSIMAVHELMPGTQAQQTASSTNITSGSSGETESGETGKLGMTFWIILGVVILVIIIALAARGSGKRR